MVDVIIESTLIVPSSETPRGKLRLSNLEQVAPSFYPCTVYFYRNNGAMDFFSIGILKDALAKTLVLFYHLAGSLVIGDDGRRTIDCSAAGALFVVARSDRRSEDIDFQPSPELRNLFAPKLASSSIMAMLQVTYLKYGGVVLGVATNHVFVDGRSSFHFFQTLARIARGDDQLSSIVPPCFDYTLLRARSKPNISFDYPDYNKADQSKNKVTSLGSSGIRITASKLNLSKEQIGLLKSQCNRGSSTTGTRVSTFCVISALLWKCYCIAQDLPPRSETRFHFSVGIQRLLQPPLPDTFFGNTVIRTSTSAQVAKVTSNPINVGANIVKAAIDWLTNEYVRSFIDYVEVNKDDKLSLVMEVPKSNLRFTSISRIPVYDADFGWGAPQLVTSAGADALGTNIISIMDELENGVTVTVFHNSDIMHKFEKAFYKELCLHSHL